MDGTFVQDVDKDEWHLWTRPGGQTDCGEQVANRWFVTRLIEARHLKGKCCQKCFTRTS
jgi:hypothetical protein